MSSQRSDDARLLLTRYAFKTTWSRQSEELWHPGSPSFVHAGGHEQGAGESQAVSWARCLSSYEQLEFKTYYRACPGRD